MTNKAIVNFGGPFPYDKSFRGQMVVMGDLMKEAVNRKMTSLAITNSYAERCELAARTEPHRASICKSAFSSGLAFRYKDDFDNARREHRLSALKGKGGAERPWLRFYGMEEVQKLLETHKTVYYFMHYYNSRYQDAETFSQAVKQAGMCGRMKAYYFIHITPEQLIEDNSDGGWMMSRKTEDTVRRLMNAIRNDCFERFIAVSEATKTSWLERIERFGYPTREAEEKIRAVPNGIDTNLYHEMVQDAKQIEKEREALGFGKNVRKIVLVMTRPSISKGIDRIVDVLARCNASTDADIRRIGFLVALPDSEGTSEFVEILGEMDNLIRERRIRVTQDLSKILRGREELMSDFEVIQALNPVSYEAEPFYTPPIKYPLTYVSDVLLHMPHAEAFGLVVAEALLSGCSVITTAAGGVPEVIGNASERAVAIDNCKFDIIDDAMTYIRELNRQPLPNMRLPEQFSLKNQFDRIIGDDDV